MEQALIITGMHRSGTSLVASLLQRVGVDIGEDLLGPGEGNPRGHFEDLGFLTFHEDLLHRYGRRMLLQDVGLCPEISADDHARALHLIASRHREGVWGFKDPRTSLFLPFWRELLPDARFLLVFRHPIDVALSLLRRGSDFEVLVDPAAGIRSWATYNQAILDFYRENSERCFLVEIDCLVKQIAPFVGALARKLKLQVKKADPSDLFVREELRSCSRTPGLGPLIESLTPDILGLYEHLQKAADFPGLSDSRQPAMEMAAELDAEVGAGQVDLAGLQAVIDRSSLLLDSEDLASTLFPILMATLDPSTAQRRRGRLESFVDMQQQIERLLSVRDEEIVRLVAHAANLEALRDREDQRVDALETHRQNLENLLAARDEEMEGLLSHSANLEALRRKDSDQIQLLEQHTRNLEQSLAEQDKIVTELRAHNANLDTRWQESKQQSEELASQLRDLADESAGKQKQEVERLEGELLAARRQTADSEARSDRLDSLLTESRTQVDSLETSLREREQTLLEAQLQCRNLEAERHRDIEALQEFQAHAANLTEELQQLVGQRQDLESHVSNLEAEKDSLAKDLQALSLHSRNLEREMEAKETIQQQLMAHGQNLEENLRRERASARELTAHGENLQRSWDESRRQLDELAKNGERVEVARQEAEHWLTAATAKVKELEGQLATSEQEATQLGENIRRLDDKITGLVREVDRRDAELIQLRGVVEEQQVEQARLLAASQRVERQLRELASSP